MMIDTKLKAERLARSLRKKDREELLASKRVWMDPPSPVFELPHRFQFRQWDHFETLLDTLTQADAFLVQENLREVLLGEWKRISEPNWRDQASINVIRALFRIGIATGQHARQLLEMAHAASREWEGDSGGSEVLLKLLKEVAINLEMTAQSINEDEDLWRGEVQQLLNDLVSSLRIYRQAANCPPFQQLLKHYRVYYLVILNDRRVHIQEFARVRNVGELYTLVNDCFEGCDTLQLTLAMQLIEKVLAIQGDEEVKLCLAGVEVLLTDGINSARHFVNGEPFQKKGEGVFFRQYLSVMSKADFSTLRMGVNLLGTLFMSFDECIPAAFKAYLDESSSQGQTTLTRKVFRCVWMLMEAVLESPINDLVAKGYWLISNVTGSANYFRQYGQRLLELVYFRNSEDPESREPVIANEVAICCLNYLCNINSQHQLEELAAIQSPKGANNCLFFCLQTVAEMIERISASADLRTYCEQTSIIEHIIYALFTVSQHAGALKDSVLTLLHMLRVEVHLEQFDFQGEIGRLAEVVLDWLSSSPLPL